MKICSKCRIEKPLTEFSARKASKDGFRSECKDCNSEASRAWQKANPEKKREASRAWHEANREKSRERVRAWGKANPDKVKADGHRKRARKRNAAGSFTSDQVKARFDFHENKCYYCKATGVPLQIEHRIPLARGGSNWPANLVPACPTCNYSKGTKTEKEFNEATT